MKPRRTSDLSINAFIRNSRHSVLAVAAFVAAAAVAGCGSDSTSPDPISKVPDFIYVSNASGTLQLYTWHKGTSTLFPASVAGDQQPQSAAGKVVFTSYRVSGLNPEIYIANLDGSDTMRLTNTTSASADKEPSISPDGHTVVFSSTRSGTSRIWTMNADGTNPTALNTGSTSDVPESSPRYSPGGGRVLFNSPRTNTSQIWIVPAAGGTATQVTHEVNGAFSGSWGPDGDVIYYVDGTDRSKIHKVVVSTGVVSDYVSGGTDVGNQDCTNALCLVTTNATSSARDIYAYIGTGDSAPIAVLNSSAEEYEPAILHP
jgi:WD40-like Beta Propeller Repeat